MTTCIACITVLWAAKGVPEWCCYPNDPFVAATYKILHCHPDDVWPRIVANRKARLGKDYFEWYDQAANLKPDVPKNKPTVFIDEQAEQAARERLAGGLMFPKVKHADVEAGSVLEEKGTRYETPSQHQPLRILPA